MPELPEVELVARYLRPHLLGRRIARIATTRPSYFFLTAPALLQKQLPKRSVTSLTRIGKYLIAGLDNQQSLLLHLGMTGQLIMASVNSPRLVTSKQKQLREGSTLAEFVPDEHTHLSVYFDDHGPRLYFRDTRKFGKVRLLGVGQSDPRLDKLGPDALTISTSDLVLASRSRRAKAKALLLDQTVLAGVGNIYADETLFSAGIHPERPANALSESDCAALAKAIRSILRKSIRAGGSSIDDYVHPDGSDGSFQTRFNVYDRKGEDCRRCNGKIQRIVIGQRSSHFCPNCQR
jgi:formamidopyrimidine-DNA glycosylase